MIQQRFIPTVLMAMLAALALSAGAVTQGPSSQSRAAGSKNPVTRDRGSASATQKATDPADKGGAPGPKPLTGQATPHNEDEGEAEYRGWQARSRLQAEQWVGNWLISRDGEAQHVWSLKRDGTGRSYAFSDQGGTMKFAYGYDIRWYFDPFTQMANIKTERRIVCRGGRIYPYFLTLKSYESDYAVRGKYAWQTTWTEASIGANYLQKSLVVFVAPLSGWHNPEKDAPCPEFPRMDIEKDIDLALDRWEMEAVRQQEQVDTTPAEGEPEFEGEEFTGEGFGPTEDTGKDKPKGQLPQQRKPSAKARVKDRAAKPADKQHRKPKKRNSN
ncbi:hypothetical protein [Microbulbifer pacificus]|uniref:Uncharacterized protein n=1 Tax=Microbulbifer pacificus TaxID=407164 RepID=A0AAU0MV19_9GAMM|nr:hypothetical protein [Microbulbifer pacificus]WOX03916.1 hypothetical protein R5R33_09190 [Microbulbifer pacificus]